MFVVSHLHRWSILLGHFFHLARQNYQPSRFYILHRSPRNPSGWACFATPTLCTQDCYNPGGRWSTRQEVGHEGIWTLKFFSCLCWQFSFSTSVELQFYVQEELWNVASAVWSMTFRSGRCSSSLTASRARHFSFKSLCLYTYAIATWQKRPTSSFSMHRYCSLGC